MTRLRTILLVLAAALAVPSLAHAQAPEWSDANITILRQWVADAPSDALHSPSITGLDRALGTGDRVEIDEAATALALKLARLHLLGEATSAQREGWHIPDPDAKIDLEPLLDAALTAPGGLDLFFAAARPQQPDYAALRAAYAVETDPAQRETIGRNMERWRWMPHSLGSNYVLVNTAAFRARLYRDGKLAGTWKVINGKPSTPSPVFRTTITGAIFNPWWEVPASIVRESVGRLVRRHPALARKRGYVVQNGRYRQKPGPGNALGLMKLVMPNPFSVFMHDTNARSLFERENRALSHGCIRVHDAIDYAATLLQGVKTREQIDEIIATGKTTEVNLARPLPLYVAYFTAGPDASGQVVTYKDIYRRDVHLPKPPAPNIPCTG